MKNGRIGNDVWLVLKQITGDLRIPTKRNLVWGMPVAAQKNVLGLDRLIDTLHPLLGGRTHIV